MVSENPFIAPLGVSWPMIQKSAIAAPFTATLAATKKKAED
jgi:hypothetical protein